MRSELILDSLNLRNVVLRRIRDNVSPWSSSSPTGSIYGTTLTASAPAAASSGTIISLDASSNLIFDGIAQAMPFFSQTTAESGQVTTSVDNVAIKLPSNGVRVAGTSSRPGGPAIEASGKSCFPRFHGVPALAQDLLCSLSTQSH